MKKFTFGTPEPLVPSVYCDGFRYEETPVSFQPSDFSCRQTARGFVLEFEMEEGTQVFGFGLQLKQLNHTGAKLTLSCNADPKTPNGDSHAPVPFFVTNKGYGMYFDTARTAEFYCGVAKTERAERKGYEVKLSEQELYAAETDGKRVMSVFIPVAQGVDVYVIEGKTILDITAQYNRLAGGGCDAPDWALGVLYRTKGTYNAQEVMDTALYMRENNIPCDIIGLEPGWQTHAYSCTYVWNKERFPDPKGFIEKLKGMGFHVSLWEHAFVNPASPVYRDLLPYSGDYRVWNGLVPDFALPEARKIFADYQREALTALGVDGFKADECDGSDNTGGWSFPNHSAFPSGLDGEQYHHLFGTLYAKTMWQALDHGPTLSESRSMGALAAPYPFVLYSDLYDIKDFVRGVVNSGFSGLLWAPELRYANSRKEVLRRLQVVTFSAQCLINAWSNEGIPWVKFDCVDEVRAILETRKKLLPKLKAAFEKYKATGIPPVRALVMEYTDDPETYKIDDEYLFCDDLLVAPITEFESDTREVYLPEGDWFDYYTGETVPSGKFTVTNENIPVFVRKK